MRTIRLFVPMSVLLIAFAAVNTYAQKQGNNTYLPKFAIKTNALYGATTTPNLGLEMGLSKKLTLDVSGNYNPWEWSDNKHLKHFMIQPELRYWPCERFYGHFVGIHGHYAGFNVSNLDFLGLADYRYQGQVYGGGISYGYQWIIGKRWSMEAGIGVGYARINYDKHECGDCGKKLDSNSKNYLGPTKVALSFIYFIN